MAGYANSRLEEWCDTAQAARYLAEILLRLAERWRLLIRHRTRLTAHGVTPYGYGFVTRFVNIQYKMNARAREPSKCKMMGIPPILPPCPPGVVPCAEGEGDEMSWRHHDHAPIPDVMLARSRQRGGPVWSHYFRVCRAKKITSRNMFSVLH